MLRAGTLSDTCRSRRCNTLHTEPFASSTLALPLCLVFPLSAIASPLTRMTTNFDDPSVCLLEACNSADQREPGRVLQSNFPTNIPGGYHQLRCVPLLGHETQPIPLFVLTFRRKSERWTVLRALASSAPVWSRCWGVPIHPLQVASE